MESEPSMIGACLTINNTVKCFEAAPPDEKKPGCALINGMFFCPNGKDDPTLKAEVTRFVDIVTYPKITMQDAKHFKRSVVEYTLGFILSALVFTLSLYIKEMIDLFVFSLISPTLNFIVLLLITIVLTIIAIMLSLLTHRITVANASTRTVEKLAEKTPREIGDIIFEV
jgi:hypothetical protein